jgi:hypothetical protein
MAFNSHLWLRPCTVTGYNLQIRDAISFGGEFLYGTDVQDNRVEAEATRLQFLSNMICSPARSIPPHVVPEHAGAIGHREVKR